MICSKGHHNVEAAAFCSTCGTELGPNMRSGSVPTRWTAPTGGNRPLLCVGVGLMVGGAGTAWMEWPDQALIATVAHAEWGWVVFGGFLLLLGLALVIVAVGKWTRARGGAR